MRKTSPIFASLLVILFTTGQTSGFGFAAIDTIFNWGSTLYFLGSGITDDTGEQINKILTKVDELSDELKHFETQMDVKLDIMLSTLLNDIELTVELQDLKTELLDYLRRVDGFYDESLRYSHVELYSKKTLQGYAETVLYDADSLPRILVRMLNIFKPGSHVHLSRGFLSLIVKKSQQNLPTECQRSITPHQLMYYIYTQLITAEMKGFATLKKVYAMKSWLENSTNNYTTELKETHRNFETGVREYHQLFTQQLAQLPRHLRRCHAHPPRRDVDFVELERLSRAKLITPDTKKHKQCNCCLSPEPFYTENGITMKVHNCKSLGRVVYACPAGNGLRNEYSWWTESWSEDPSKSFGRTKTCSYREELYAGAHIKFQSVVWGGYSDSVDCKNWYCSVEEMARKKDDHVSWRISSKPQISNIWNNMIVTGVEFIVRDKTLYLKIQQGKFLGNGLAHNDVAWKDFDIYYNVSGAYPNHYSDERIDTDHKSIYLDDIKVPKDSVVTGVQIMRRDWSPYFRLYVHATKFDLATGKLDPSKNLWCNGYICDETGNLYSNLTETPIQIDMGAADDPTREYGFNYDPETKKMITFTHTDARKDAGHTTIPFIDLQPLQVQPAFPLSGVGLYFRGKKGFGGYIAPRIFTLDVTERMKTSISTQ